MDLQERFDELDNIVSTLRALRDEITDKDYIEQLDLIKYQAMSEMDEINSQLEEEYDREQKEMDRQFMMERIWWYGRNKCKRHNSNDRYRIN